MFQRLIDLPTLKMFIARLLEKSFGPWPLALGIRHWFEMPRARQRIARRTRLEVDCLEERWVPSTLVVNELADTNAVSLVSGLDASGHVSLRSAIEAADNIGGNQTIQFDPTVFANHQTITLKMGRLTLNDAGADVTIQGPAAGVTISGNHASEVLRVTLGTSADLSDLTIAAGDVTGWGLDYGGGIYNNGDLTLTDSTVSGNVALTAAPIELFGGYGGGIYNHASLTMVDCTISGNVAGSAGAGIENSTYGTANLTGCTISRNALTSDGYSVNGSGGGICNGGTTTLNNCTISGNSAGIGGGIANSGTLTVNDGAISGNATVPSIYDQGGNGGAGGGVFNEDNATITNSTLSGNSAVGYGTGGAVGSAAAAHTILTNCTISGNAAHLGGGVGTVNFYATYGYDPVTITDCTISGNRAASGGGIDLGIDDDATLTNSTVSGNTATLGGGIYLNLTADMTCANSTISGNTATYGAGIFVSHSDNYGPALVLDNTIVAGDTSHSADGDIVGPVSPASTNNLIGNGAGILAGIRNGMNNNQIGAAADPINAQLEPLGNYGGPTETMPPMPGSPAIDAGSNAAIPAGVTTDQRGLPRIVNGIVDIGADEWQVTIDPNPAAMTAVSADANAFPLIIKGDGFDPKGTNQVVITDLTNPADTVNIGPVTVNSLTQLTVAVSGNFTDGDVLSAVITTDGVSSTPTAFAIVAPVLTAANVSIPADAVSVPLIINGLGFDSGGSNSVVITDLTHPADVVVVDTVQANSANALSVTLSGTFTAGDVLSAVVTTDGAASAPAAVAVAAPVVTSVTTFVPVKAAATPLVITGFGFDPKGTNTVVIVDLTHPSDKVAVGKATVASATKLTVAISGTFTAGDVLAAVVTTDKTSSAATPVALAVQTATITSAASATLTVGQAGSFTVTTKGYPTAVLSEIDTLPAGVNFIDNGNGTATLSGPPLAAAARKTPYRFTIEASNGIGAVVKQTFTLTIV